MKYNIKYLERNLDYMNDYVYIIYAFVEFFGQAPYKYLIELPPQAFNVDNLQVMNGDRRTPPSDVSIK